MTKFYGKVGFVRTEKTAPGVWTPHKEERSYTGDVTRNYRRWDTSGNVNDDFNVTNTISIIADNYAYECMGLMRYVVWMGTKWKISSVEVERPRLLISIGGVYDDPC